MNKFVLDKEEQRHKFHVSRKRQFSNGHIGKIDKAKVF